uniref:Uncharacterized protein n=1 Tax=Arundo donax TaxID=35708 RepID=A0A0A9GGI9_ARUDO
MILTKVQSISLKTSIHFSAKTGTKRYAFAGSQGVVEGSTLTSSIMLMSLT